MHTDYSDRCHPWLLLIRAIRGYCSFAPSAAALRKAVHLALLWRIVTSLFLRKPIGDQIMSRRVCRLLLGFAMLSLTTGVSGQSTQPSTANGEWPHYTADLKGTRYSPLDQINASNFNKLEIAWHFKTDSLGPFLEFKLEATPLMVKVVLYTTAGTRRS